jgi:hypothetical protein
VSEFDHLLLTRLAVRLDEAATAPAEDWLRGRLELFARFCAPSVNGQTVAPDRWLLFFDEATPEWFVSRCEALVTVSLDVIRLAEPWSPGAVARVVAERTSSQWLITSRLDSDDALARGYVETVQAQFDRQERSFINLLNGAQWSEAAISTYAHPSNAFISLVERRTPELPATVFVTGHDRVDQHAPLIQIRRDEPMWLQVVHEGNLLNGESGWRVQPSRVLQHFTLGLSRPDESRPRLVVGRARSVLRLLMRVASRPSRLRWIPKYMRARLGRAAGKASV